MTQCTICLKQKYMRDFYYKRTEGRYESICKQCKLEKTEARKKRQRELIAKWRNG